MEAHGEDQEATEIDQGAGGGGRLTGSVWISQSCLLGEGEEERNVSL
jgi:hypothetical protein